MLKQWIVPARRLFQYRPAYFINHIVDTATNKPTLETVNPSSIVSQARNLPLQNEEEMLYLESNEIETRMFKVIRHFAKIDLKRVNWTGDLIKDVGLDSLEKVALIASIEHEFTVVFEDRLFDNLHSLDQIKKQLQGDDSAF